MGWDCRFVTEYHDGEKWVCAETIETTNYWLSGEENYHSDTLIWEQRDYALFRVLVGIRVRDDEKVPILTKELLKELPNDTSENTRKLLYCEPYVYMTTREELVEFIEKNVGRFDEYEFWRLDELLNNINQKIEDIRQFKGIENPKIRVFMGFDC